MLIRFATALGLLSLCLFVTPTTARAQLLYPVRGPQAGRTPAAVFPVNLANGSGALEGLNFFVTLAYGEKFFGNWKTVTADRVNAYSPQGSIPSLPQINLEFAWDAVYGQGFFVASVLGEKVSSVVATGEKGTVVQLEFDLDRRRGVGVDSNGNLYKMAF